MNFARSPWLIPLLLLLVILLFGANKLPSLARNMGQSMRIFKSEVSEMRKSDDDPRGDRDRDREHDRRDDRSYEPRLEDRVADDRRDDDRRVDDRRYDDRAYDPRDECRPVEREVRSDDPYRRD